jgi:hypothetical protein
MNDMTTPLDRTPGRLSGCGDTDTLLAYVYDEVEPETREEIDLHLQSCTACAQQAHELRGARESLQTWQVPAPPGFRLVPADAERHVDVKRPRPVWQWAAAAVLTVAAAGALANLEVQTGPGGFALRLGWARHVGGVATAATQPALRADLTRVETDLQNIKSQLIELGHAASRLERTAASDDAAQDTARPVGDERAGFDELMRGVRELVEESERRQQRELALRLMQVSQEYQDQRLIDMATIDQGFNQLDYLVNVSQR